MNDDFKNFKCLQCGNCCKWPGYVRVSEQEVNAIADFLKIDRQKFIANQTRLTLDRSGLSLIEKEDKSCIFLQEQDNGFICLINEVKPQQCRNFPFSWRFKDWEKECPGGQKMLLILNNYNQMTGTD